MPMLDRSGAKRSTGDAQEQAMQRWIVALDVANDRLVSAMLFTEGYAPLFVAQVRLAVNSASFLAEISVR